jgi:hypothetical protein
MTHSLYNDADGKTRAVTAFLNSIDDDKRERYHVKLIAEAKLLARQGRLNEALEHIGYTNDQTPLHFPSDEKR